MSVNPVATFNDVGSLVDMVVWLLLSPPPKPRSAAVIQVLEASLGAT